MCELSVPPIGEKDSEFPDIHDAGFLHKPNPEGWVKAFLT